MQGIIVSVARDAGHHFSKSPTGEVRLVAGLGVEGDAHAGEKVQHLSRMARDPNQPNLRQVHLIHHELLDELQAGGFPIVPGALGENVTTRGIDLLSLPSGSLLHLGDAAVVRVTGLRNPCSQIESFHEGLLSAVVDKSPDGRIIRKTGIMSVVVRGGVIRPGDRIRVELPPEPHAPLEVV